MRPGKQWVGSTLVAIHDGGRWRHPIIAVCGGRHWHCLIIVIHLWMLFIAVHHAPLSVVHSCPSRIVKLFGVAGHVFRVG